MNNRELLFQEERLQHPNHTYLFCRLCASHHHMPHPSFKVCQCRFTRKYVSPALESPVHVVIHLRDYPTPAIIDRY